MVLGHVTSIKTSNSQHIVQLLQYGADINANAEADAIAREKSPLRSALISRNIRVVEAFLRAGAHVHDDALWELAYYFTKAVERKKT